MATYSAKGDIKLWLVANHRPKASPSDDGLWRRVLVLPFTNALPEGERDPSVKQILTEDPAARAAVLAWAIRGALEWRREGLQIPEGVRHATAKYRDDCDDLAGFFSECCVFEPSAKARSAEIRAACEAWCQANGVAVPGPKVLAAALTERGCRDHKVQGDRGWLGIGLRTERDTRDG